jgi:predicted acetyltransferase
LTSKQLSSAVWLSGPMNLYLTQPSPELQQAYIDFLHDDNPERVQVAKIQQAREDWPGFLRELANWRHGQNLPKGAVAMTIFWLTDGQTIYAESSFRHYLNERLLWASGHIGYAVRLSQRRKGYGKLLLALTLEKCRRQGCPPYLLITCNEDNHGSRKIIEANGGQLDMYLPKTWDGQNWKLRYWVKTF